MKKSILFLLLFLSISVIKAQSIWNKIEPIPAGGQILGVDVNSQNHFFALSNYGLYISTNMGETWELANDQFINPFISPPPVFLEINSKDEIFVVINAGDYVLKSTDNGATFIPSGNGITNEGATYLYSDLNDDLFLATFLKPFRSTDGGENWEPVVLTPPFSSAQSFAFKSEDEIFAAIPFFGVLKSTDNGTNWSPAANNGIGGFDISSIVYNYIENILYAGTTSNGLFKSTDDGDNWTQVELPPLNGSNSLQKITNIGFIKDLKYARDFGNLVAMIFEGNDISAIIGINEEGSEVLGWDKKTILRDVEFYSASDLPNKISDHIPGIISATLTNGVLVSNQEDNLLEQSEGINAYVTTNILNIPGVTTLIGTDVGIFKKNENESDYSQFLPGSSINDYIVKDFEIYDTNSDLGKRTNSSENGTIIYTISGGTLYSSSDYGETWDSIFTLTSFGIPSLNDLAIDDSLNLFLATFLNGVKFSSDSGKTWEGRNEGLSDTSLAKIIFIKNSSTLFTITQTGKLYKSTNKGLNWNQISDSLLQIINDLKSDSDGNLFAASSSSGVFKSTNNGEKWGAINSGLIPPYPSILSIDSENKIYAGSFFNGIFISTNNGESWDPFNEGLPVNSVVSLSVDKNNNVFAGILGYGIYTTEQSTSVKVTSGRIPSEFHLEQNYPNPFNPTTNISFRIAEFGSVSLKIYDVLGREVATLINEELSPGSYSIEWNAAGFSSGIYFYKLEANNIKQTKKMMLLK